MAKSLKHLTDFLFELGMLKKFEHCGTKFAGVKHPDTLAEHTCRSAQIGYALALAEKGDPGKVALMCLIHDIGEIRVNDTHRIALHYINTKPGEKKAVLAQTQNLPHELKNGIRDAWNEYHEEKTKNAIIARDADLLETILQAKEYFDIGYKAAERWMANGSKYLKTKTAKKLFREIMKTEFHEWWDSLNEV